MKFFKMTLSMLVSCFITSCQVTKEVIKETAIESIKDPQTGTQVFIRESPNEPYGIDIKNLVKARKTAKKKKVQQTLENY